MRSVRSATIRLLLTLSVVILAVYTIVQAIDRPVSGKVTTYRAEFSDVFGLHTNADVRIRGVQIGKVVDIHLEPSGLARVTFTARTADRLVEGDTLAIRFQNLVGQRYLAITKAEGAARGQALDPRATIGVRSTTGSFDITQLFNGLRPMLQGADPAVFNTFATHMLDLLQGEGGVGIGDVLADVGKLTTFASDRRSVIAVIINNLGTVANAITGKSEVVNALLNGLNLLFNTLESNLGLLQGVYGTGSQVFPPVVDLLSRVFDLGLGGHDNLTARLMEIAPDTSGLTKLLSTVPSMLSTLNASMTNIGFDAQCSHGAVGLPAIGQVLLGGGKVTLCRA